MGENDELSIAEEIETSDLIARGCNSQFMDAIFEQIGIGTWQLMTYQVRVMGSIYTKTDVLTSGFSLS
jgi:hypothetical protein